MKRKERITVHGIRNRNKCRNRNYRERKGNKKKNEIHERKLLLEIFKKKKNSRKEMYEDKEHEEIVTR